MFNVVYEKLSNRHGIAGLPRIPMHFDKEWTTLESAERSARTLCRIHRVEVRIERKLEKIPRLGPTTETIAFCRIDALDRVWTDIALAGEKLL